MKFWMMTLGLLALAAAVVGFSGLAGEAGDWAKGFLAMSVIGTGCFVGTRLLRGDRESSGPRDRRPPGDGEAGSIATVGLRHP
jgi:hypothetical protein